MDENKVKEIVEKLSEVEADIRNLKITVDSYMDYGASVLNGEVEIARCLIRRESESVVAFVIAHEYAHHFLNDSKFDAKRRVEIIESIENTWENKKNGVAWRVGVSLFKGIFGSMMYFEESKIKENRADFLATYIILKAGYSFEEAVDFLKRSGGLNCTPFSRHG